MRRVIPPATGLLAAIGFSVVAQAQNAKPDDLDVITVFGQGTQNTVREVPQTADVFAIEFIENVQATFADDVVRFVPNAAPYGWSVPLFTEFRMRGFLSSTTWNGMVRRDTHGAFKMTNIERVEVLKGPASVLYGSMEPGAVINLVTKRPQREFDATGSVRFGSDNEQNYEIDIGGPLSDRVRARLSASRFSTDTPWDNSGVRDLFIAPSVEFDLGERTLLTLDGFFNDVEWPNGWTDGRVPIAGAFYPNPVGQIPLSANYQFDRGINGVGTPSLNSSDIDTNLRLAHEFNDTFSMNVALSYHRDDYDEDTIFFGGLAPDNRTLTRFFFTEHHDPGSAYLAHVDLRGKLTTGSVAHDFAVGMDYTDSSYDYVTAFLGIDPIDIFAPEFGNAELPDPIPYDEGSVSTKSVEAFVQDRLTIGKLHLLAGARFSDYQSTDDYTAFGDVLAENDIDDQLWSTQFGALYDVNDWLTIYASRNESFVPRTATIFGEGRVNQPERGIQYEVGAKFDLGSTGLSGNVVYFDIDKKDLLVADADHVGFVLPLGGVNSKGVEISVEGNPAPGLSIYLGYGYNPTEITEADTNVGNRFFYAPKQTMSAYVNYEIQGGRLAGLDLTGSLQHVGERYSSDFNNLQWPSYSRVDIGAAYPVTEHVTVGFNVRNLLESTVYTGFGTNRIVRDPFRSVFGTVTFKY